MVTMKITEDARTLLRVLAAHKGKSMYEVAEDLFWNEAKRLKLPIRQQPEKGSRRGRASYD